MSKKKPTAPPAIPPQTEPGTAEGWLQRNDRLVVMLLTGVMVLLHLHFAATCALNPDEALHYSLANKSTIHDAYVANNSNAHPPMLIMTLHFWRKLGHAEWFIRLIPILGSAVMVWFSWLWARLAIGPAPALVLAGLTAFLPPLYSLAQDLRQYMPMMAGIAPALYFFERCFQDRPVRHMLISAAALQVAILSNYSAAWFTAGFGCYALIRLAAQKSSRGVWAAWAGGQVAALAIYAILYVTHIAPLRKSEVASGVQEGWLRMLYRMQGDDAIDYMARNGKGLMEYMFGSAGLSLIGSLLVLIGFAMIWVRRRQIGNSAALAALLFVPLLVCLAAALNGMYPFGGSRHSMLFCYLLSIPAALAIAEVSGRRMIPTAAVALIFIAALQNLTAPEVTPQPVEAQDRQHLTAAVEYLKGNVGKGAMVFIDYQTALLLCYYADPDHPCPVQDNKHFWESKVGTTPVAISKHWSLSPSRFVEELRALKQEYKLPSQAEVWVIDSGWGDPIHQMLQVQFSGSRLTALKAFGGWTGVFRIPN